MKTPAHQSRFEPSEPRAPSGPQVPRMFGSGHDDTCGLTLCERLHLAAIAILAAAIAVRGWLG